MATHPTALPQLTLKAVLLGLVLSAVLAGANAYLGLFAGLTVSASIPAAVVSMAVLKLFARSNVLESNIVQTAASAGESLAAGVIFTLPALVLLNYWSAFDYLWVSAIAGVGGLLGVAFTVPLRRSLIVEQQLRYPEGTATAEVLKVGSSAGEGAKHLAAAALAGAAIKLAETGLKLWSGTAQGAAYVGGSAIAYIGTNLSPALLGVGYIVGLNVAALVFAGGALGWFVALPLYSGFFLDRNPELAALHAAGMPAADLAFEVWSAEIRYLGVGAMLVGGVAALVALRGSLLAGVRSGLARRPVGAAYDHTAHDAPMRLVLIGVAVLVLPLFAMYQAIVGDAGVAIALTAVMAAAGFLFSSVAAYMAGLVGSSNNPISGITIATILLTALMLVAWLGPDSAVGPAAAIMVGAVVCCAAAIGGDNLQDLKAGYLLGATPWRQQVAQCLGVLSAMLVMAPILNLLLAAYGLGAPTPARPDALLAPQATLMASVATGVFGGGLPWAMIAWGAALGLAIHVLDEGLRRSGSGWRAPVLAVAVGVYLPLELSVPILGGGVIAHLAARRGGAGGRRGVLFAAGLITGEALIGIAMAIPIVASGDANVLAAPFGVPAWAGVAAVAGTAVMLLRIATRR